MEVGQKIPIYKHFDRSEQCFQKILELFIFVGMAIGGVFCGDTPRQKLVVWRFQDSKQVFLLLGRFIASFFFQDLLTIWKHCFLAVVPAVRTLEITADVVGNDVYKRDSFDRRR